MSANRRQSRRATPPPRTPVARPVGRRHRAGDTRVNAEADGNPIQYAESRFAADRVELKIEND
jgi:hypothetical protein